MPRKIISGVTAVCILQLLIFMFWRGGGGVTYNLTRLSQKYKQNSQKLAAHLQDKTSPFSISASMSKSNSLFGQSTGYILALLFAAVFVLTILEITQKEAVRPYWHSVHIIVLSAIFVVASAVGIFSVQPSRSARTASTSLHLTATTVSFLCITLFFVFAATSLDGNMRVLLFTLFWFEIIILLVLVYSFVRTKSQLHKYQSKHTENNIILWTHIKSGVMIASAEISYFVLIMISLVVLTFASVDNESDE